MPHSLTPFDSDHLHSDPIDEVPPVLAAMWGTQHGCAYALLAHMRDLSEGCYCAGWDSALEGNLWVMVLSGKGGAFGLGRVTDDDVALLTMLARAAGGWWRWTNEGETWTPLAEWEAIYAGGARE